MKAKNKVKGSQVVVELLNGSFDVVLLKIGGRFKFFYTQNRLGCVFVCLNVIRMSIFVQIDTIIQKLQRYLHKVRHRNTPFCGESCCFRVKFLP